MSPKQLSMEDRILWGKVARTTAPLPGRKLDEPELEQETFEQMLEMPAKPRRKAATALPEVPQPAILDKPTTPRLHPIEKPTKQKLAKGRLPIEGKVDLHGLTQTEAHALLLSFLRRAHSDGRRHVLVVTGKGLSKGGDGVLRRSVPGWFATPPFRTLVSGHEEAARHHGGEGALYVRLRRQEARGA